jgi:hypothetical protein
VAVPFPAIVSCQSEPAIPLPATPHAKTRLGVVAPVHDGARTLEPCLRALVATLSLSEVEGFRSLFEIAHATVDRVLERI